MIFPGRDELCLLCWSMFCPSYSLACEATICWIAACMTTFWAAVPWEPCVPRNLKVPLTYGGRGSLRCFRHVRTLKWSYSTTCLATFCGDFLTLIVSITWVLWEVPPSFLTWASCINPQVGFSMHINVSTPKTKFLWKHTVSWWTPQVPQQKWDRSCWPGWMRMPYMKPSCPVSCLACRVRRCHSAACNVVRW